MAKLWSFPWLTLNIFLRLGFHAIVWSLRSASVPIRLTLLHLDIHLEVSRSPSEYAAVRAIALPTRLAPPNPASGNLLRSVLFRSLFLQFNPELRKLRVLA